MSVRDLTPSERRILQMLADGKRQPEIAKSLRRTHNAVNQAVRRIRDKMDVDTSWQAVAKGFRLHILT